MELILIRPTAKLEMFQKNAEEQLKVLENTTQLADSCQVSSSPVLKYFSWPYGMAS